MNAQTPPNFTLTDTEGKVWNLYNELGKGKSVVLDFFFVNCKPCQKYTPMIQSIYESYGADTGDVVIFGISDRDANTAIKQFEQTYGVTYPSCGTEGGGDTITDLFQLNYSFLSWPTYAVICPDTTIYWDIIKSDSFPALIDSLKACPPPIVSIPKTALTEVKVWFNGATETIEIDNANQLSIDKINLFDLQSRSHIDEHIGYDNANLSLSTTSLSEGIYYLHITSDGRSIIHKCMVYHN